MHISDVVLQWFAADEQVAVELYLLAIRLLLAVIKDAELKAISAWG